MPELIQSLSPELQARVEAVEAFISLADRLFEIHVIEWSAVEDDWRLLAINGAFRRQLESITAAILLTKQGGLFRRQERYVKFTPSDGVAPKKDGPFAKGFGYHT